LSASGEFRADQDGSLGPFLMPGLLNLLNGPGAAPFPGR